MNCEHCTKTIENVAGKVKKRFCSDKCRKAAKRAKPNARGCVRMDEPRTDGIKVTPDTTTPDNFGQTDCKCRQCATNRSKGGKHLINHGPWKDADQLADNEINRVALPGDSDYLTRNTIELCAKCGDELPKLSKPRTRPGTCYPCVMGKATRMA